MGRATIKPLVPSWKGWRALGRGLASNLFELGANDLTVMRVLRQASVTVTRQHYIKVRDPKMTAAMADKERLEPSHRLQPSKLYREAHAVR